MGLEKALSETRILNCGDPQGSIFGAILFLLYVNDIKTAPKNCDLRLYANGTSILKSHQNVNFIGRNLNYVLTTFVNGS